MNSKLWLIFLIPGLALSGRSYAQSAAIDFSGLDLFWDMADKLSADSEPTSEEWVQFLNHPGYAITEQKGGRHERIKAAMRLSFKPSLLDSLEFVLNKESRRIAKTCQHLLEASGNREELKVLRTSLSADGELMQASTQMARQYLPRKAKYSRDPVVYVILFEANGFGGEDIAVDQLMLMRMSKEYQMRYLGHELYHSYRDQLDPYEKRSELPDIKLIHSLTRMPDEGIASLIDKKVWLEDLPEIPDSSFWKPIISDFTGLYSSSNEVLQAVDEILVKYSNEEITADEASSRIGRSLPWGGHPTGTYMALLLEEAMGTEYFATVATDPIKFIIDYNVLAKDREGYFAFSPQAVSVLKDLRTSYIKSQN